MSFRENLKVLISYLKEFPNPKLVERHIKLNNSCQALKDSVDRLTQENAWLKKKLELEGTYVRHNGVYFFETPDGHNAPFCSRCWDRQGRLVKLEIGSDGSKTCPQCTTSWGL